jgi:hypothetical protein
MSNFINPQGRKLDLSKDIKAMEDVADKQIVKSVFEDQKANIFPKDGNLFIKWFEANGKKIYTIVCGCENNHLLRTKGIRGLRCINCGFFHSWKTWIELREKIHRIAYFNNGVIQKLKQPNEKYEKIQNSQVVFDSKKKQFFTKPINGLRQLKSEFEKHLRKK